MGNHKGFRRKFEKTPFWDFGGSSYMIDTLSLSGSDSRSLLREFEHDGHQHLRIHETTQTMSLCYKRTEREMMYS
jgi:hypothetical protein